MSERKIRRRLQRAIREREVIRVERSPKHADRLDGVLVGIGKTWAFIARTGDGGFFEGWTAFRVADVTKVTADTTFQPAFARTQPEWPPVLDPRITLDTTAQVLIGLSDVSPLIGVEKERERGAIWIGELDEVDSKWLWLHEVHPDASWYPAPLGYNLKAITALSIGTRYLTGLAAIAGRVPINDEPSRERPHRVGSYGRSRSRQATTTSDSATS